jgi:hypothetical protein
MIIYTIQPRSAGLFCEVAACHLEQWEECSDNVIKQGGSRRVAGQLDDRKAMAGTQHSHHVGVFSCSVEVRRNGWIMTIVLASL